MPAMMRPKGKGTAVAYALLGEPFTRKKRKRRSKAVPSLMAVDK